MPRNLKIAFRRLEEQSRELKAAQVEPMVGLAGKKPSPPCDEPGFLAAQVLAIAAETGWPEERILFMPLARLAQYQHCLMLRNGVRTKWDRRGAGESSLADQLSLLRVQWPESVGSEAQS